MMAFLSLCNRLSAKLPGEGAMNTTEVIQAMKYFCHGENDFESICSGVCLGS